MRSMIIPTGIILFTKIYSNLRGSRNQPIFQKTITSFSGISPYESTTLILKFFFLFRDPINHSHSLLKQHQRFSKFQREDSFILEYMNWLGHHEFGLNLKSFEFPSPKTTNDYSSEDINFWLVIWINYYARILEIMNDKNVFFNSL